jgi:enoyl-CoA hydratase/carnithine racemase
MSAIDAERKDGLVRITFTTPVLSVEVLAELATHLERMSDGPDPRPVVLRSAHESIFLAGAHLREIAGLDATTSADYALFGRAVLDRLRQYPAPTVAAVGGSCSGGGFDLVLASDAVVASAAASFGHPGVARGLVTGWSGTTRLPKAVGRPTARAAITAARPLSAADLQSAGVVHSISDRPERAAERAARSLGELHSERLLLWRSLRDGRHTGVFRALVTQAIIV